jgi:hypothetical protein
MDARVRSSRPWHTAWAHLAAELELRNSVPAGSTHGQASNRPQKSSMSPAESPLHFGIENPIRPWLAGWLATHTRSCSPLADHGRPTSMVHDNNDDCLLGRKSLASPLLDPVSVVTYRTT